MPRIAADEGDPSVPKFQKMAHAGFRTRGIVDQDSVRGTGLLAFDLNDRNASLSQKKKIFCIEGVGEKDSVHPALDKSLGANPFLLRRAILIVEKHFVAVCRRLVFDAPSYMRKKRILHDRVRDMAETEAAPRAKPASHDVWPVAHRSRSFRDAASHVFRDIALGA